MASAIGTALFYSVLQPMAAKAMDIIEDKGLEIVRSMPDKAMDNIERDISRLQTTLYTIEGIIKVAEEKQIDEQGKPVIFIQKWLHGLVDIGYEARDVLDDFITFSSCINTAEEASNPVNFISSFILSYVGGSSSDTSNIPLAILNGLEKNIRSVRERFDEKKMEGETIKKEGSESVKNRRPEVGSSINKQSDYKFVEREEMKEGIMEKILQPKDDSVDVVAICGMGGIGKTTLAQSIYNDERVKKVPRRWSCVGENKFSAEKVIREILNDQKSTGIANLQEKLVKEFSGDRFLIVLDDVWDVDDSEWSLLFNPLTEVGKGGMIIITKREKKLCPELIKIQTTYDLKPLSEEDSWSLFESCAYMDGKSDSTPNLKDIGKEIVKKLKGLPLALKVVGRSLWNKDSSTWTNFLESKLTKNDEVMSALRWSYNHLPPHLKTCFTYCALFPKDHVFDNEKVLVEMWMAHDLIQKEEEKRPEDVGAQYFEQLANASLLQYVDGKHVMHNLIHDLTLLVSNGEFASANSSLTNDQMKKVRHITITTGDYSKIPRLCKIEKLLTLYTTDEKGTTEKFDYSVLDDVFKQLKSIRVLVLPNLYEINKIPNCISELRHLRYLDVRKTGVKYLGASLCHLYNLQMLAAPLDATLRSDIMNMVNLRYIRANLYTCKGVGKLTSLQELSSIHVWKGDNIRELGDMQILRGKLAISRLENVEKLEDDIAALMEKQTLMDELVLKFDKYFAEPIISKQVLDALGCPPNLTYLKIDRYNGIKPPSWMVDAKHKFDKLHTLELLDCPKLESLPPLGELKSLKCLSLNSVGVKRLGDEFYGKFADGKVFFPSLESLKFSYMNEWKEWDDIIIENSGMSFFPYLTRLEIKECAKLVSVLPVVQVIEANNFCKLRSLESLIISQCKDQKSLPADFHKLQTLELSHCPTLESLPPLGELKSLKHLSLTSVVVKRLGDEFYGKFTDGKVFFPSLESLSFGGMKEWEEWDYIIIENSSVSFFPLLTTLELSVCPKLESLPRHGGFDKLQMLELYYCFKLESLPPLGELTSLKHIHLKRVGVKRLGNEFYGKFADGKVFFPSLESLKFSCVMEWKEWDDIIIENSSMSFFPLLTTLEIDLCPKLVSVLPVVKNPIMNAANFMTSLSRLEIRDCFGLRSLPVDGLPPSLRRLAIRGCPLLYERCKDESGPDWHKINNIPDKFILQH